MAALSIGFGRGRRLGPSRQSTKAVPAPNRCGWLIRFWFLLVFFLSLGACGGGSGEAVRVLLIGNSHTAANDLAGMVQDLAGSADLNVEVTAHAPNGWWWRDHAARPRRSR